MWYTTFRQHLEKMVAEYSPGEVTLTYNEGTFEPSALLERLGKTELLLPVGREEPPHERAPLAEGRLLTLGFAGEGGRQFLVRWSFYRHGWNDTSNTGAAAHYYVPWEWAYEPDPQRLDLLVSLCGRVNMCFRFPFKLSGEMPLCTHCEKKTQK